MILRRIDILDFKNIAEASIEFSDTVNCLLGSNGMGKSNLLEAIHFLSFARPVSSVAESALIRHGSKAMLVRGNYLMDSGATREIACSLAVGKGKTLKLDGKEYGRISQHIGKFPIVAVSPSDSMLVTGGAEMRRRLMDMVISQAQPEYISNLIRYNKALENRNRMLRAAVTDPLLFESVEATLEASSEFIRDARRRWVEGISEEFASYYRRIAGADAETASIAYKTQLDGRTFAELMNANRARDAALGYTSAGVHRDDLAMMLGEYSMRALGSQGQIKTFTIALRLAIYGYLRRHSGLKPVLLFDDIFDKLDSGRVANILGIVSAGEEFGQIFITDTNRKHLDDIIAPLGGNPLLLGVQDGVFTPLNV